MKERWLGGLSIKDLVKQAWREANDDDILGHSAELSYYFLLAIFPMLIFLTSLVGSIPELRQEIFVALARFVPGDAMKLVNDTLNDVTRNRSGSLLSFGVVGALWAASGGVTAVIGTLNAAYDAREERSFWKVRLIAIGLTAALSLLIVGGTALIMYGDRFSAWVAARLGMESAFAVLWGFIDYLLGFALLFLGLELIYYFGPNVEQKWVWITPGATFAVINLVVISLLLSLYLRFAPSYSATYGSLGAVIVLMLWLYLMGGVILLGGEINAIIMRAAGKIPRQKEGHAPSRDT